MISFYLIVITYDFENNIGRRTTDLSSSLVNYLSIGMIGLLITYKLMSSTLTSYSLFKSVNALKESRLQLSCQRLFAKQPHERAVPVGDLNHITTKRHYWAPHTLSISIYIQDGVMILYLLSNHQLGNMTASIS